MTAADKKQLDLETLINSGEDLAPLQHLLTMIETEQTQSAGIALLHDVANHLSAKDAAPERLSLRSIEIPGSAKPLRLLLHPAVFTPEHWGRAFAEGLLKNADQFEGKRVVELGTGSGWVSILLLLRTGAVQVYGLDLNPVAVVCAKLNMWLNGTTSDGTLLLTRAGQPLVKSMRVAESDLLSRVLTSQESFDHVIGCIPQVLHPDLLEPSINDASTEDLYDLSNYCFRQGILEDRYGLPLIARALEEAQLVLAPGGKITLILGGRPGPQAIDDMFRRRGYEPELVWSRRIAQADDTDLASLVKLETTHGIKFHFFMSRDSELAVSAQTAVKLLNSGQLVYHDLLVYSAMTRFERPTFEFVRNLQRLKLEDLRKELDFSRMSEEQISYLSRLSGDLINGRQIPYPHERGDLAVRKKLSNFLQVYCHYSADPEDLFISAERGQLISMVLRLVSNAGAKVLLSTSLETAYREVIELSNRDVILSNDDLAEIFALDDLLSPDVLIVAPVQLTAASPILLQALAAQALEHPDRLYIIDDSANFDISSDLNSNILIRLMADFAMPSNVVLLYGLVKNTVQPDLELSFMLNAPASWRDALDVGAELTYSRIAYPSQHYYEWLFDDLLSFTFSPSLSAHALTQGVSHAKRADSFANKLPVLAEELLADPVFEPKPISLETQDLIRLDYGEFQAAVPDELIKGLFKGFLENSSPLLPALVRQRVSDYFQATRSAKIAPAQIVLAQGVFGVFGAIIAALRRRLGRAPLVAIPKGSYGPLYPLVRYHGGELIEFETAAEDGFLANADKFIFKRQPDLLWLTQPANPSGLFYDRNTIHAILTWCANRGVCILADEIFFLLSDIRMGSTTSPDLSFGSHFGSPEASTLFVTDGLSKAFAAGGLRCGFVACPDAQWAQELQAHCWMPPQSTLRAWDNLYSNYLNAEETGVHRYLTSVRALLSQQRDQLLSVLEQFRVADKCGGRDRGGLFVLAAIDHLAEALAKEKQVLVNPGRWARLPRWARICFGLPQAEFDQAMNRLRDFLELKAKG